MYKKLILAIAVALGLRWLFKPLWMTWNTLDNLATGQLVTDTHLDQIRENIEHLGAMKFADVALSNLTAVSACRHTVGSYVGNGVDNRAITGLGYTPKTVIVIGGSDIASSGYAIRFGTSGDVSAVGTTTWTPMDDANGIQSLDADGFTVGNGFPNANGYTYYWAAWG